MANTARVNQQRPMNCRFDDILTFISVVEAGSVTSAAARLNVSKSVISKRISDLEAALRVELFQRSTGNVKPTEVARSCYERIVPLIRGITEVTERIFERNEYLTGRLRVTAPISFGTNFLGPVIAEIREALSGAGNCRRLRRSLRKPSPDARNPGRDQQPRLSLRGPYR